MAGFASVPLPLPAPVPAPGPSMGVSPTLPQPLRDATAHDGVVTSTAAPSRFALWWAFEAEVDRWASVCALVVGLAASAGMVFLF